MKNHVRSGEIYYTKVAELLQVIRFLRSIKTIPFHFIVFIPVEMTGGSGGRLVLFATEEDKEERVEDISKKE